MKFDLSIIYVYYNTPIELINSLKSIKQSLGLFSSEIIVIDNASSRQIPKNILKYKNLKLIHNQVNIGYGAGLNQGVRIASGRYLLLANPDTIFQKDSLKLMIEKMEVDSDIGILGPQLLDSSLKIQKVGNGQPTMPQAIFAFTLLNKLFPNNKWSKKYYLPDFDRKAETEIPVICGACMLIKKSIYEKTGGMDERFFMYFEESDLCYRIKHSGLKVLYYPKAKIIHLSGRSSNNKVWIKKTFQESRYKFFKKYHNIFIATLGELAIRFLNKL